MPNLCLIKDLYGGSDGKESTKAWVQSKDYLEKQTLYPLSYQGSPYLEKGTPLLLPGEFHGQRRAAEERRGRQEKKGITKDEIVECHH